MKILTAIFFLLSSLAYLCSSGRQASVTDREMQDIYNEVKTPYKYGLVLVPPGDSEKLDCPGLFRSGDSWYMSYIIFDGRGYETWLTSSSDLLHWNEPCRIMSFPRDTGMWDSNQRAGYPALQDPVWEGSYEPEKFSDRYWMSYLGGSSAGYEEGRLAIGMAFTTDDPGLCSEWKYIENPVLSSSDSDVRWWENLKLYKSTVIHDRDRMTGHEFVMYYNAYGDSLASSHNAERIGMAVSDDMVSWQRYLGDPVLNHYGGITGDPQIARIGSTWVMFYFGAFWPDGKSKGAFNRFACSHDLVHWTDWKGENLIEPSEQYDSKYAHKSYVVKWKGTVYHFYCAVNDKDQRGIALATSADLGNSNLSFSVSSSQ